MIGLGIQKVMDHKKIYNTLTFTVSIVFGFRNNKVFIVTLSVNYFLSEPCYNHYLHSD